MLTERGENTCEAEVLARVSTARRLAPSEDATLRRGLGFMKARHYKKRRRQNKLWGFTSRISDIGTDKPVLLMDVTFLSVMGML